MSWREPAESNLAALSIWIVVRTRLTQQRRVSRSASWRLHKRKPAHTVVLRTRNKPKSTLEPELNGCQTNVNCVGADYSHQHLDEPASHAHLCRHRPGCRADDSGCCVVLRPVR